MSNNRYQIATLELSANPLNAGLIHSTTNNLTSILSRTSNSIGLGLKPQPNKDQKTISFYIDTSVFSSFSFGAVEAYLSNLIKSMESSDRKKVTYSLNVSNPFSDLSLIDSLREKNEDLVSTNESLEQKLKESQVAYGQLEEESLVLLESHEKNQSQSLVHYTQQQIEDLESRAALSDELKEKLIQSKQEIDDLELRAALLDELKDKVIQYQQEIDFYSSKLEESNDMIVELKENSSVPSSASINNLNDEVCILREQVSDLTEKNSLLLKRVKSHEASSDSSLNTELHVSQITSHDELLSFLDQQKSLHYKMVVSYLHQRAKQLDSKELPLSFEDQQKYQSLLDSRQKLLSVMIGDTDKEKLAILEETLSGDSSQLIEWREAEMKMEEFRKFSQEFSLPLYLDYRVDPSFTRLTLPFTSFKGGSFKKTVLENLLSELDAQPIFNQSTGLIEIESSAPKMEIIKRIQNALSDPLYSGLRIDAINQTSVFSIEEKRVIVKDNLEIEEKPSLEPLDFPVGSTTDVNTVISTFFKKKIKESGLKSVDIMKETSLGSSQIHKIKAEGTLPTSEKTRAKLTSLFKILDVDPNLLLSELENLPNSTKVEKYIKALSKLNE